MGIQDDNMNMALDACFKQLAEKYPNVRFNIRDFVVSDTKEFVWKKTDNGIELTVPTGKAIILAGAKSTKNDSPISVLLEKFVLADYTNMEGMPICFFTEGYTFVVKGDLLKLRAYVIEQMKKR